MNLAGTFCLLYLINKDDIAEFKLAWAVPICALPIFGTLLFMFVDNNWGSRSLKRQLSKRLKDSGAYLKTVPAVQKELEKLPGRERALFDYGERVGGCPAYADGKVTYFPMGEDKWKDLLLELEKAEEFIFLEYFIIF